MYAYVWYLSYLAHVEKCKEMQMQVVVNLLSEILNDIF